MTVLFGALKKNFHRELLCICSHCAANHPLVFVYTSNPSNAMARISRKTRMTGTMGWCLNLCKHILHEICFNLWGFFSFFFWEQAGFQSLLPLRLDSYIAPQTWGAIVPVLWRWGSRERGWTTEKTVWCGPSYVVGSPQITGLMVVREYGKYWFW